MDEIQNVPLIQRQALESNLLEAFRVALDKLCNIWDNLGIYEDQKQERINVVVGHLQGLLEAMVEEEETLHSRLLVSIENCKKEIFQLCQELDISLYEPNSNSPILHLEKELRSYIDELSKNKQERLKKLKHLQDVEQKLCFCLKMPTHQFAISRTVPSEKDLHELEQNVKMLQDEKHHRLTKFKLERKEISLIMESLKLCPSTTFEHEVVYDDIKDFILSRENMEALEELLNKVRNKQKEADEESELLKEKLNVLWDRLNIVENERKKFISLHTGVTVSTLQALREEVSRCEILKMKNIKIFIEKIRDEIVLLWEKCWYGINEKKAFEAFDNDSYTEELLELHEQEVKKLRQFYTENEEIFMKVIKRENLWNGLLQFEKIANDPNRLTNRGGALLQEERNRKKLIKELPKVEQELFDLIDKWQESNKKPFLINGLDYKQRVMDQWNEHKQQKENEKLDRQKQKAMKLKEEAASVRPTFTPGKRKLFTTPNKTPAKVKKIALGTPSLSVPARSIRRSVGKTPRSPRYTPKRKPAVKEVRRVLVDSNSKRTEVLVKNMSPPSLVSVTSYTEFTGPLNQNPEEFLSSTGIVLPIVAVQPPSPDRANAEEL